jgi:hypothetical protein
MVSRPTFINALKRAGFTLPTGEVPKWHLKKLKPGTDAGYFQYPMKTLADPDQAAAFLELNGTPSHPQVVHASRPFWRDGVGGPTLSLQEAKRVAYRRSRISGRAHLHDPANDSSGNH